MEEKEEFLKMKKREKPVSIAFVSPIEQEKKVYEDTLPEELETIEDVRQKYGKVVWCKYIACKHNESIKGLQRTSSTILKNMAYSPINEQEHIWSTICTRDEIAITFNNVLSPNGSKIKVPSCFVSVTGVSGHTDFSKLLQPDGSPFGGNIDSQHANFSGFEHNNF